MRAEEEEHRQFLEMLDRNPLLMNPKSPAQVKHEAFHDKVVARMKAGPVEEGADTRVEVVAQEALAVLARRGSKGKLEPIVAACNEEGPIAESCFLKLERRREVVTLNVEYYMVQAGLIRPSIIVRKVSDSCVACWTTVKTCLTLGVWQDPEENYRSDITTHVKVA